MKKNISLFFFVFLLLYALLEGIFLYAFPRVFPANIVALVDEGLQPLLQSSKSGIVPVDYIAIMGDSNAAGMGDWATESMSRPMASYSTAHLLHEKLGRDVVTFGAAGAGSVRTLVTEPISRLAYSNRYTFRSVQDPDVALVYFYEGNDFYDNADFFQFSFFDQFDRKLQFDEATYQNYLQQFALDRDDLYRKSQRHDWQRYLPFAGFVNFAIRVKLGLPMKSDPDYDSTIDPPWRLGSNMFKFPGYVNRAKINGNVIQLPDYIQGPPVGLNEEEFNRAWFSFEQSLKFSRIHFSNTRFILVYIPSVLTVYDMQSDQISVQGYQGRHADFTLQQAMLTSNGMREKFKKIAAYQNLQMIDATDALRAAAQIQAVHGPEDWNHLNRVGYEVLANVIEDNLKL